MITFINKLKKTAVVKFVQKTKQCLNSCINKNTNIYLNSNINDNYFEIMQYYVQNKTQEHTVMMYHGIIGTLRSLHMRYNSNYQDRMQYIQIVVVL